MCATLAAGRKLATERGTIMKESCSVPVIVSFN